MPANLIEGLPVDNMNCLDIALQAVDSSLRISDGREIPFARAILTIRNRCDSEVLNVEPHATLGQERGTVQEVTSSFSQKAHASIPPGGQSPGICTTKLFLRTRGCPARSIFSDTVPS